MKTLLAVMVMLCVAVEVNASTENQTLMAEYCKFSVDANVPSLRSWNNSFAEQLKTDLAVALRVQSGESISQFSVLPQYQSGPILFNQGPAKLGVYDFKGIILAQGVLQNSAGVTSFQVLIPAVEISPYRTLHWVTGEDEEIQGLDCSFIAPENTYNIINRMTGQSLAQLQFSRQIPFIVSASELNLELSKKENKGLIDIIISPRKKHHHHGGQGVHVGGRLGRWFKRLLH